MYDRAWLKDEWQAGARPSFLFFWGHRAGKKGRPGVSCLSQWWPAPFSVDGERYATAEHWMMVQKARLFRDEDTARAIFGADSPKDAKQLGRQVAGFDERTWRAARNQIVIEGNLHKFTRHVELGRFLVSTGDAVLVEASPVDDLWGIGLSADDPRAADPMLWQGENLLGFALMSVRDELRP